MASRSASASVRKLIVQNISHGKHGNDIRKRLGRKIPTGIGIGIGMSEEKGYIQGRGRGRGRGKGEQ